MTPPAEKAPWMVRIFLLLALLCFPLGADELPLQLKGILKGKVGETPYEQPFDARMEPGEKQNIRVEMEEIDLEFGLQPRWHYSSGNQPDGILLTMFMRCRKEGLKLQRTSSILVTPGEKASVDMHEKDAEHLFTVEVEAAPAKP